MAVGFGWLLGGSPTDLLNVNEPSLDDVVLPWMAEAWLPTQRREGRVVEALERVLQTSREQPPHKAMATLEVLLSAVRRLPPSTQATTLLRRVHRAQRRCQRVVSKQRLLRRMQHRVGGGGPFRRQDQVLRLARRQRKRRRQEASNYRRALRHPSSMLALTLPSNQLDGMEQRRLVDGLQLAPMLTLERLVTWPWLLKQLMHMMRQHNLETHELETLTPDCQHQLIQHFLDRCRQSRIDVSTLCKLDEQPAKEGTDADQEQLDTVRNLLLGMGICFLMDSWMTERLSVGRVPPVPAADVQPPASHGVGQRPPSLPEGVVTLQPNGS